METPINKKEDMKSITFTPTGEVRPPKKGEWFIDEFGSYSQLGHRLTSPTMNHKIVTMTESDVQIDAQCVSKDDALNTQKSLGVSEPSLVQESVDSRFEPWICRLCGQTYSNRLKNEFDGYCNNCNSSHLTRLVLKYDISKVASLQAENKELQRGYIQPEILEEYRLAEKEVASLTTRLSLSEDRVKKMSEALKPFAFAYNPAWDKNPPLEDSLGCTVKFLLGHIRKAHMALESQSLTTKDDSTVKP